MGNVVIQMYVCGLLNGEYISSDYMTFYFTANFKQFIVNEVILFCVIVLASILELEFS